MAVSAEFTKASEDVKNLASRPGNDDLLALYAFFKQATEGDVSGKKPGRLDFKGRAKFEAWEKIKGMDSAKAEQEYINKVDQLKSSIGLA